MCDYETRLNEYTWPVGFLRRSLYSFWAAGGGSYITSQRSWRRGLRDDHVRLRHPGRNFLSAVRQQRIDRAQTAISVFLTLIWPFLLCELLARSMRGFVAPDWIFPDATMHGHTRPLIRVGVLARTECDSSLVAVLKEFDAVYARSWGQLEPMLTSGDVHTALIDPGLLSFSDQRKAARVKANYPNIALIAYASLDAASLNAIARMNGEGYVFHNVLIRERDCKSHTVSRAIESACAHRLVNAVLGRLERDLAALPHNIFTVVVDVFSRPARYNRVSDLASESRVPVYTLYRHFQQARLGSPKKLLSLAKICRACFLFRHSDASVKDVAMQLGYDRATTLLDNCARMLGCTPSSLRSAAAEEDIAAGLLEWWCKRRPSRSEPLGVRAR